jgi:hypothetical protein
VAFFALSHSTCMNLRTEHTKALHTFAHYRLAHITTGIGGAHQRLLEMRDASRRDPLMS